MKTYPIHFLKFLRKTSENRCKEIQASSACLCYSDSKPLNCSVVSNETIDNDAQSWLQGKKIIIQL